MEGGGPDALEASGIPTFLKNHMSIFTSTCGRNLAASRKAEYRPLLELVRAKLPYYLNSLPAAPIGEWVNRRTANASRTGYEFCSVTELFDSYALLEDRGPPWATIWNGCT